jgi:hypothetical protein
MDCTRELLVKGRHWSGNLWIVHLATEVAHDYLLRNAPFSFTTQLRIREAIREMSPFVDCYFISFPK